MKNEERMNNCHIWYLSILAKLNSLGLCSECRAKAEKLDEKQRKRIQRELRN